MTVDKANEVTKELFESLCYRYQIRIKTSMKGSDFVFDCCNLLHCKRHKKYANRGGSYTYSPEWIKNKKATKNSVNDDNKCFQHASTITLIHEEIAKFTENIKNSAIYKYNWKGIDQLSGKDDWKIE